jgi:hypothetical protein
VTERAEPVEAGLGAVLEAEGLSFATIIPPIESPNLKGDSMARRRYQKGSLILRGEVWYGRWWEDFYDPGSDRRRKYVCVRLGTKEDFPTRKLALRELEQRLARRESIHRSTAAFQRLCFRNSVQPGRSAYCPR